MKYDDMPAEITAAAENDWLDVTFVRKEKIDGRTKEMMEGKKRDFFGKSAGKIKALLSKRRHKQPPAPDADVFGYAKATYTSAVEPVRNDGNANTLTLPSNADVAVSGGDITLTGGTLAVSLKDGTVKDATETSVTVNVGENFDIVYSNLSEVMVARGDKVTQYQVLGKYGDSAVVNLIVDGQKVTGVTADGYTVSWQLL